MQRSKVQETGTRASFPVGMRMIAKFKLCRSETYRRRKLDGIKAESAENKES